MKPILNLVKIVSLLSWMINHDAKSITMMSGDKCDTKGLYWASGCGHADAMEFSELEVFPIAEPAPNRSSGFAGILPLIKFQADIFFRWLCGWQ
jgi:hypothetical protein